MSKLIKTGLVLSGIILFGAGCARNAAQPEAYGTVQSTPADNLPRDIEDLPVPASEAVIEYKDGMFNPSTLRVLVGTKVVFVNKGDKTVWPASGRHPTHEICPGFDALRGLKTGEIYSYVFVKPSECPFHNHLAPAEKGSIEVKPVE